MHEVRTLIWLQKARNAVLNRKSDICPFAVFLSEGWMDHHLITRDYFSAWTSAIIDVSTATSLRHPIFSPRQHQHGMVKTVPPTPSEQSPASRHGGKTSKLQAGSPNTWKRSSNVSATNDVHRRSEVRGLGHARPDGFNDLPNRQFSRSILL